MVQTVKDFDHLRTMTDEICSRPDLAEPIAVRPIPDFQRRIAGEVAAGTELGKRADTHHEIMLVSDEIILDTIRSRLSKR